jgi:hypothetical protein
LPEKRAKMSKAELMQAAREEKAAKTAQQKKLDIAKEKFIKTAAEEFGVEEHRIKPFPKPSNVEVGYIELWDDKLKSARVIEWSVYE